MSRQIRAPAVGEDEPGSEAPPGPNVFATVGGDGSVGLMDADGVASDFHGHVAGRFDADGFEAKILVAAVSELAKNMFDGFRTVGGFMMRGHECAVRSEDDGGVIVVSGIKGGDEIL